MAEEELVYGSLDEIVSDGAQQVEFRTIDGFAGPTGRKIRIGSVTAGDMIEWSEANEGDAKRTAGLRLITKSLVNAKGERYADDPKNIQKFRGMRHRETQRIVEEILELNGMKVKKDKEEAAKKD